jgi:hypothetical protein
MTASPATERRYILPEKGNLMLQDGIRYVTFAEAVLLRPKMYTLDGSYGEVIAFLEGFFSGMAKHSGGIPPPAKRWFAFRDWFAKQLVGPHDEYSSDRLFGTFRAGLDPDKDAIAELLKWVSRFEVEFSETEYKYEG